MGCEKLKLFPLPLVVKTHLFMAGLGHDPFIQDWPSISNRLSTSLFTCLVFLFFPFVFVLVIMPCRLFLDRLADLILFFSFWF